MASTDQTPSRSDQEHIQPPRQVVTIREKARPVILVASIVTLVVTLLAFGLSMAQRGTSAGYSESPYLTPLRLSDVIAAIQALGTYRWHDARVAYWARADRLGWPRSVPRPPPARGRAMSDSAQRERMWQTLFAEHLEFFRLTVDPEGKTRVALHWRWARSAGGDSLTSEPLEPEQVGTLITSAIELHSRALAHKQEQRWLVPLLFAFAGSVLGAATGAVAGALLNRSRASPGAATR